MNLVPQTPGKAPNYWCTWNAQAPQWAVKADSDLNVLEPLDPGQVSTASRRNMNQKSLFEDPGWAVHFYPSIRSDLYLCLDDGWDVPVTIDIKADLWRFGSLILNEERFPGFPGTPAERLRRLNARIKSLGWRGLALWVASQCEGDSRNGLEMDMTACEAYWRERARWSAEAGIEYWKVDWGKRARSIPFRRMLTAIAREEAPGLVVEHARTTSPLNNIGGNGRFADSNIIFEQALAILNGSDVLRTYDEIPPLNTATTLDRISALAAAVRPEPDVQALLNCEDNMYIGAALGCTVGIMRVPIKTPLTRWKWPRIDEAVRTIRWQRIARPFGLAPGDTLASPRILTDNALIPADHWCREAAGRNMEQHAPSAISRRMPLPAVAADGPLPYVLASHFPSGATAVAALPRCRDGELAMPPADVTLDLAEGSTGIGVFGRYRRLKLKFKSNAEGLRVWAQDLLADEAQDITSRIAIEQNAITIEGGLIDDIGLSSGQPDDPSDPGLVLRLAAPGRNLT